MNAVHANTDLNHPNQIIIIPNKIRLSQILKALISEGISCIDIVADFDYTLTRKEPTGNHGTDSSYSLFSVSPYLSKDFKEKRIFLYQKYSPFERDPTLNFIEKDKLMQEWYSKTLQLLSTQQLTKEQIVESIKFTTMLLRNGSDQLLKFTTAYSVPVYVVSAGIQYVISSFLETNIPQSDLKSVKLIANTSVSNPPYVTTTNKDIFLTRAAYPLKKNAILIGDLPEDSVMANHSEYHNVLKIGFLNDIDGIETKIDGHMQCYDIIIKGKGSMKHVVYLLSKIAKADYEYNESEVLKSVVNEL